MVTLGDTLVVITSDGNVFGSQVLNRVLQPVFQFTGAKIGYNPQDRFMVTLGNTLVVITSDGGVFGADVAGRNIQPVFQFKGAKIGYNPQDRFMVAMGNTLYVITRDGNVYGADVVNRTIQPVFLANPPDPGTLTWGNLGTGSGTTSGGSTKCAYALNLTIRQDGSSEFWGSYTNRGDVWGITAPSQTFGVSIVVLDSNGHGYSFAAGGQVPSAPQPGCTASWDKTEQSAAIAANWDAIVARYYADWGYSNQANISDVFSEIVSAIQGVANEVGAAAGAVSSVIEVVAALA